MIISPHTQQSIEWHNERIGLITGSMFKEIITTKGMPTVDSRRTKYMEELAGEIITGRPTKRYVSAPMKAGTEKEDEARLLYEMIKGVDVQTVGLCYKDEQKLFGASPDGLVGLSGGFETKNAEPATQIMRFRTNWNGMEHFQQVQGGIFICEREWWDLQSYCESMRPIIIRFYRNEPFIKKLDQALNQFHEELMLLVRKLKGIK